MCFTSMASGASAAAADAAELRFLLRLFVALVAVLLARPLRRGVSCISSTSIASSAFLAGLFVLVLRLGVWFVELDVAASEAGRLSAVVPK